LQALAAAGFGSAYEVYQQQQLVGALQYVAYQQQMLAWTQATTIAQQNAANSPAQGRGGDDPSDDVLALGVGVAAVTLVLPYPATR